MQIFVLKVGSPSTEVTVDEGTTVGALIESLNTRTEYSNGTYSKFLNGALISSFDSEVNLDTVLEDGDTITYSPKIEGGN